jgi:hypothetical protein
MKKTLLVIVLVCAALGAVSAQEGAGGAAASTMADAGLLNAGNLENYSKPFLNGNGSSISSKYIRVASDGDFNKIAPLGGNEERIDTPLEIALLSTCAGVVDVRPVEASNILGNAKQADLKLGSAVYQEMQVLRFLGNAAAVGRHEGIIKFITDRGNVSRAEIENYLKQGITAVVKEKFNEIDFRLENWSNSYNATLSRNLQIKEYTLNYWGQYTGNVVKKISGTGINGLLAIMENSPDFDTYGIEQTRNQADLIPAIVYESWVEKKITTVDAVKLAADTIANFYMSPTNANYDLLVGMFGLFKRDGNDPLAEAGLDAYRKAMNSLNEELKEKVGADSTSQGTALARAARARNSDYSIFAIPYDR